MAVAERLPAEDLPNLPPLTDRQAELLRYIWRYWLDRRYTPTQREMCQHLGIASTNAAPHLNALERKGYVRRSQAQGRRNIRITRAGAEKLAMLGEANDDQLELFQGES